jgi:hypothetical protein
MSLRALGYSQQQAQRIRCQLGLTTHLRFLAVVLRLDSSPLFQKQQLEHLRVLRRVRYAACAVAASASGRHCMQLHTGGMQLQLSLLLLLVGVGVGRAAHEPSPLHLAWYSPRGGVGMGTRRCLCRDHLGRPRLVRMAPSCRCARCGRLPLFGCLGKEGGCGEEAAARQLSWATAACALPKAPGLACDRLRRTVILGRPHPSPRRGSAGAHGPLLAARRLSDAPPLP